MTNDLEDRFAEAVASFWQSRSRQQERQVAAGRVDAGSRGAVTGGGQMEAIEQLVVEELLGAGVPAAAIHTKSSLELPGYFRPEKKWDLLVVQEGQLLCAIEHEARPVLATRGKALAHQIFHRAMKGLDQRRCGLVPKFIGVGVVVAHGGWCRLDGRARQSM